MHDAAKVHRWRVQTRPRRGGQGRPRIVREEGSTTPLELDRDATEEEVFEALEGEDLDGRRVTARGVDTFGNLVVERDVDLPEDLQTTADEVNPRNMNEAVINKLSTAFVEALEKMGNVVTSLAASNQTLSHAVAGMEEEAPHPVWDKLAPLFEGLTIDDVRKGAAWMHAQANNGTNGTNGNGTGNNH